MRFRDLALAGLVAATLSSGALAEALPAPVDGVTFDEWAAGNARLSNNQDLAGVLKTLGVDETRWKAIGETFTKALAEGGAGSAAINRYGEVFANPNVGRFKGAGDGPEIKAKLATYEDWARVQAHLSVGVEAGVDPQAVLKEHDLTVYEWSQESGNWIREFAAAAGKGDDGAEIGRMNAIREGFEAEYRKRYGLKPPPDTD